MSRRRHRAKSQSRRARLKYYRQRIIERIQATLMGFVGQPINEETEARIIEAVGAALVPESCFYVKLHRDDGTAREFLITV